MSRGVTGHSFRRPVFLAAAIVAAAVALAGSVSDASTQRGAVNRAPRLYEPLETVARPAAGDPVRFRWSAGALRGDAHLYDEFRVFKGNQAYADSMIFNERVPAGQAAASVPAPLFSEPGVYCWTVKHIGSRTKSREAFSIFKVS